MNTYKNIKKESNIKNNALVVNSMIVESIFKSFYLSSWASNIKVNVLSRRLRYPSANLGSSRATINTKQ